MKKDIHSRIQNSIVDIVEGNDLSKQKAEDLSTAIMNGELSEAQISAVLISLRMKGETVDEITGFVMSMRNKMKKVSCNYDAIDTCGTGGDGLGTFNISTTVALVSSAAGVKVAKHGNRGMSSKCGSADVLEEVGVSLTLTPVQASDMLLKTGFTFLFAQEYHPSMNYVAPVRKKLHGIRTVFNYIGPLSNPACVKRQIIGVPHSSLAQKLSRVVQNLGYDHVIILFNEEGMDEVSTSTKTSFYDIKRVTNNKDNKYRVTLNTVSPEDFDIKKSSINTILGGTKEENARILVNVLKGEKGPKRDVVLINSGFALYVSGKVRDIKEGIQIASETIDSGKAHNQLQKIIDFSKKHNGNT